MKSFGRGWRLAVTGESKLKVPQQKQSSDFDYSSSKPRLTIRVWPQAVLEALAIKYMTHRQDGV